MSASGASFSFKSVNFGGPDYGVYVELVEWPRLPEPRVNVAEFSQADGGVTQGSTFRQRRIKLKCGLVADDESARNTQAGNVTSALAAGQAGVGPLIVDYFSGFQWNNARLVSGVDVKIGQNGELFDLEFLCDPWPTATAESSSVDNVLAGLTALGINIEGSMEVAALWLIQNGATESAGITLANAATGETAVYTDTIAPDAWLRLDSETQKFEMSDDDGATWSDVPAHTSGVVPQVSGGEENTVTVSGITDGLLDVTYTAGYRQ